MSAQTWTGPHWDVSSERPYITWFDPEGNFLRHDYQNLPNADLPGSEETSLQAPSHDFSSIGPAGNTAEWTVESSHTAFDQYNPAGYTDMDLPTRSGQYTSQQSTSQGLTMLPVIQPMDVEFANNLYDTHNQSAHADAFISMVSTDSQEQQDVWLPDPAFTCELS